MTRPAGQDGVAVAFGVAAALDAAAALDVAEFGGGIPFSAFQLRMNSLKPVTPQKQNPPSTQTGDRGPLANRGREKSEAGSVAPGRTGVDVVAALEERAITLGQVDIEVVDRQVVRIVVTDHDEVILVVDEIVVVDSIVVRHIRHDAVLPLVLTDSVSSPPFSRAISKLTLSLRRRR
jgi:hypothetical protein